MAENEYLDSTKSRRWLSVAEGLIEGCVPAELAERVVEQFRKTLRKIGHDIPLADFLANINDPLKLSQLWQGVEGASDVKMFMLDVAHEKVRPIDAIEQFLCSALESCLYDIPHLANERGGNINLSKARQELDEARSLLAPDLRRMAEKLSENPAWKPQQKRKRAVSIQSAVDSTKRMLGESLIAGFRP